jgi:hypothetical protein
MQPAGNVFHLDVVFIDAGFNEGSARRRNHRWRSRKIKHRASQVVHNM